MKNFSVTFRGKDGKQDVIQIAAEDRQGVFDELAKRGISAIRVEEANGKAKPRKSSPSGGSKPSGVFKGAIAGVIVVAAAVGAWFFLTQKQETGQRESKTKKSAKIAEVTPDISSTPQTQSEEKVSLETKATNEPEKIVHCVTNRQGKVIVISDEEWANFERAQRDTTLRTRTEKRLRLLASVPPGMPVPPMPGNSSEIDDDIVETLKNEIEILPGDTEREIEHKKFVMDFKEYIKGEMAQGKKPSEAYNDYISLMNSVADLTTTGAKMAREMREEGDEEGARMFLETVNAKLDSMGAPPIDLDRRPKEKILNETRKEKQTDE